jgi:hypothetical protein
VLKEAGVVKLQAALAQVQLSLNDLVASSCQSITTTTTPTRTTCLGHYWPIGNQSVTDTITGKQATSLGLPQFFSDRNGLADGAILVNSTFSAWQLPVDTYVQGDTTVTLWVKGNEKCSSFYSGFLQNSVFGNLYFKILKILNKHFV